MNQYEIELGEFFTNKIRFIRKNDPEFKNSITCPRINRMDRFGYSKEENLKTYLKEYEGKFIYFLLSENDSVFHPFYIDNDQQFYCIRSRHING